MQTIKLYDKDAYAVSFRATVISSEAQKDTVNRYEVVLDQTLFFPEEGGQSPDKGTINGFQVVYVSIENGIVTHIVEAENSEEIAVGATVEGAIDWTHRFSNMQQHTGEHIFSGIVHKCFGFENVGFHLSDSIVTMDFNGVLSAEEISKVEHEVNEVIAKNIKVEVTYPTEEELKYIEYRSKIEIKEQVRIVTIPGYDVCACCAPHVSRTGEIGMLKVMSVQNHRGGIRISMLCGFRALEAFRKKSDIVSELTGLLTTSQENLAENVSKLKASNQSLKAALAAEKAKVMEYKLASLPTDTKNALIFERELDTSAARNSVNKLVDTFEGICAVFVGNDAEGYSFIIGSKNVDCCKVAEEMRNKLNARGGGKPQMIQGSVKATKDEITALLT